MRTRWNVLVAAVLTLVFGAVIFSLYWPAGELMDHGCGTEPPGPAALVAVDAQTGDLLWSRRVGHASNLVRGDGVVAVDGFEGELRGVDASNGEIVWCSDMSSGSEARSRATAAGPVLAFYSFDGNIVGVDPTSGSEQWRTAISAPSSAANSPGPTVHFDSAVRLLGGDVLRITDGGAVASVLMTIDPETGLELEPLPASLPGVDTISDHRGWRLVGSHTPDLSRHELRLEMIDADTDIQLWSRTVPGYLTSLMETGDGDPLVAVLDQSGGTTTTLGDTLVSAYSGADGTLLWQQSVERATSGVYAGRPGTVIVSSGQQMSALSTYSGEIEWTADNGNPGKQGPYTESGVYADVVYMADQDAYIGIVIATRPYRD